MQPLHQKLYNSDTYSRAFQFSIFPCLHAAVVPAFPTVRGKAGMGGGSIPTEEDTENCMTLGYLTRNNLGSCWPPSEGIEHYIAGQGRLPKPDIKGNSCYHNA